MPTVIAFASGSNEAREIRGFALAGMPVGASASNLRESAIVALQNVEGPVFVDSGAFSEVAYNTSTKTLELARPISPREWRRRLGIYLRLAHVLGSRLTVVAPDRVGDQQETLRRLAIYRPELAEIATLGAHILIPLQLGTLSHEAFYAASLEAAGVQMVPAFTMKKAATTIADARRFLRSVSPSRIHLLGMGATNRQVSDFLAMVRQTSPETDVTMDSNRLRAVTGQNRRMTVLENEFRVSEATNLYNQVESPILDTVGYTLDYTDSIGTPSLWASESELREIAFNAGFTIGEIHAFLSDPDSFLNREVPDSGISYWELPTIAHVLDAAWEKYVRREVASHVRTAAIKRTFEQQEAA